MATAWERDWKHYAQTVGELLESLQKSDINVRYASARPSFMACDAVSWLVRQSLCGSRAEAVRFGQAMIRDYLIASTGVVRDFTDDKHVFRFQVSTTDQVTSRVGLLRIEPAKGGASDAPKTMPVLRPAPAIEDSNASLFAFSEASFSGSNPEVAKNKWGIKNARKRHSSEEEIVEPGAFKFNKKFQDIDLSAMNNEQLEPKVRPRVHSYVPLETVEKPRDTVHHTFSQKSYSPQAPLKRQQTADVHKSTMIGNVAALRRKLSFAFSNRRKDDSGGGLLTSARKFSKMFTRKEQRFVDETNEDDRLAN